MKKRNKILALLAALAIAFSSVACSNNYASEESPLAYGDYESNISTSDSTNYEVDAKMMATEESMKDVVAEPATENISGAVGGEGSSDTVADGITANAPAIEKRKLIINSTLELQTKEFDKGVANIENLTNQFNGYMESSSIQGTNMENTSYPRYAYFTLRIPASGSEQFIDQLGGQFNVVSTNQSTQDVTDSYYDIETRLETLVEQEKRLNVLLDKGGDLQYLLEVEREIANVRYQINSIHNQLKNMDSYIEFSQITITLSEVIDYPDVQQIDDTFAVRVQRAFRTSWNNFVEFGKNSVISIIYLLPSLVVLLLIFIIIIFLIRRSRKKSKKKLATIQTASTENNLDNKIQTDNKLK